MGSALKAEKIARHFATVVSPSLAATPFGKRAVPTLPAIDFSLALATAVRTYGNSAPLFLLTSVAPSPTGDKLFVPVECLLDNPVEISFATAHGHIGTIVSAAAPPVPAAINCGVLSGPEADCGAEIEGLVDALAAKMAAEFQAAPLDFLLNFSNASDKAVADVLMAQAKGAVDWVVGAYDWTVGKASQGIEYVLDGGAARDISSAADYVSSGRILADAKNGAVAAYEWGDEALDTLRNLDYDELYEACKQWLRETLGTVKCDMRDALAAMLADPRPMAAQMGELYGTAKVAVTEAAAAVAVDVLVSKGAASAATRVGSLVAKAGPRVGKLADKIGDIMRRVRRRPDTGPSRVPHPQAKPHAPPHGHAPDASKKPHGMPEKKPEGDTVDGPRRPSPCLSCPATPRPVNTIFGCKILGGEEDLDFIIDAPLPLHWQRTYVSSNANESCLGQGWSLPLDLRLEVDDSVLAFIDAQGRRIEFSWLAVGAEQFSPYEHTTLRRTARNVYELLSPDGLRLVFGLAPSDYARVAARDSAEQRQAQQFEQALQASGVSAAADTADRRAPQGRRLLLLGLIGSNGDWLRLHYAANDLPQVVECSDGRHVGLHYDPQRPAHSPRLIMVSELLGVPDAQGRFAAARTLVEYRYDGAGDLVAVVDDSGAVVRSYAWSNHILVGHGEPGGISVRYEWDQLTPQGRVRVAADSSGEILRFDYDRLARRNRISDASGRVTTYCYDEHFYLTRLIAPDGAQTRYARDGSGHLIAVTDALERTTRYVHDGLGRLLRLVRADGSSYSLRYEEGQRRPCAVTDPLGQTTHYRYDARGNLLQTQSPDGALTRYELGAQGLPVRIHDARGGTAQLSYDRSGRLVEYRDCLGQATRHSYDERGNLIESVDALGQATRYAYQRINRQDRLVAVSRPDGATERLAYDSLGRLIAHSDAAGQATRYVLAQDGQPLQRENALGHSLRYQYDVHGRLLALSNESGAVYRFAWDAADRLISERGFDGRRIDYRYNAAGELIESADGAEAGQPWLAPRQIEIQRTRYQRDALGRLTDKFCTVQRDGARPDVSHSRYRYNLNGQLVQARNRQARLDLHYTAAGQLAREITQTRGGQASSIEHAYDGLGNRYQSLLPDGRILRHHLYGSGHVDRITLDDRLVCGFERDALRRETVRRQGALQTFYERDALGRLLRQDVRSAGDRPAAEPRIGRHYRYDRSGQLAGIDDLRNGQSLYQYDATGRLRVASSAVGDELFAFDPAGNLLDMQSPPDAAGAAPGRPRRDWNEAEWQAHVRKYAGQAGSNPPPAADGGDPAAWDAARPNRLRVHQQHRYRYDRWGNCVEKRSGAHEVRRFRWNAQHQLEAAQITRVEHGRLVSEHWGYDYDPFGRRVAKYPLPVPLLDDAANDGVAQASPPLAARRRWQQAARAQRQLAATHFLWDGNRLLAERQGGHQQLYLYEPGSFAPLALVRSGIAPAPREEVSPLPVEMLSLKGQYPQQWAAMEQRRQKLLRKLGVAEPPAAPSADFEIFHIHTDHLGTPRELTDDDGHLVWSARYKVWGGVEHSETPPRRVVVAAGGALRESWQEQAEPVVQNLRFQGQYADAESGLHYNRFRYYDPDVGRFVSQDPIGLAGGINTYQYAPNPLEWIDPLGLTPGRFGKKKTGKLNIDNRCDGCKLWDMGRSDRVCEGHVKGVGIVKILRNPTTGEWWSKDQTGHGKSTWKVFDESGGSFEWKADANEYGDFINGKHKGATGRDIPMKGLSCKDI